jgi:predicted dehydrogenase
LVAGFCWRYASPERALFERVLDGQIGEVQVVYGTYYTGPVKSMRPASDRAAGVTDLEWQLRNWMNFSWLSGDSFVEQAVHAVDWMCWAMKDVPPLKAVAVGGRQIPAEGGNIFDHFEVNYEYAGGARGFIGSRQQAGCMSENHATIFGTKGRAYELGFSGLPHIKGHHNWLGDHDWKYTGPRPDMYQIEHNEMFASIRAGKPINNGTRLATSTLAAIMGRMAAYTGEEITWEKAMNSKEHLVPASLTWDMPLTAAPMPMPGRTKFV